MSQMLEKKEVILQVLEEDLKCKYKRMSNSHKSRKYSLKFDQNNQLFFLFIINYPDVHKVRMQFWITLTLKGEIMGIWNKHQMKENIWIFHILRTNLKNVVVLLGACSMSSSFLLSKLQWFKTAPLLHEHNIFTFIYFTHFI